MGFNYTFRADDIPSWDADTRDLVENRDRELELYSTTIDTSFLNLNASNLTSGTVPSACITGAYTGITGVGTLSSFSRGAPVTKTASFTLANTENWIICNGTASITVTLPGASTQVGREISLKNIAAFTVVSASSNVVPLTGGAAGTAILATAGTWATLVSDGTNWIIMQS